MKRWVLWAASGLSVFAIFLAVADEKFNLNCSFRVEEGIASGANSAIYRWDDTAQQYIYNWSTKGFTAGAYRISAKLDDGVTHYTIVNLK